jgi:hypothetical protein
MNEEAAFMDPTKENAAMPVNDPHRFDTFVERRKSVFLAGVLSFLPGLGQVYLGYYRRGFLHIAVTCGVITLLSGGEHTIFAPFLGIFLGFFWLYNIIDATRMASLYNSILAGHGPEDLRRELVLTGNKGSIAGGIGLILAGGLFFLNTMFHVSLDWLRDWWPLIPVGLGVYLLYRGIQDRRKQQV